MTRHELARNILQNTEISDKCQWLGTTFDEEGRINDCGDTTVGAGLFCDPKHEYCAVIDVCKSHKGTAKFWTEEK